MRFEHRPITFLLVIFAALGRDIEPAILVERARLLVSTPAIASDPPRGVHDLDRSGLFRHWVNGHTEGCLTQTSIEE